ncbi:hypothetical protein BU17DRAFT_94152 [Hysterangium stoloniferum]|nr:hypothetical protein BU17DRAFT_94152 [Hysterangium stoloniferum]
MPPFYHPRLPANPNRGDDDDDDSDDDHELLRHILQSAGTGVAIAALTLLTVGPITFLNFVRKRSMASMVLLEIGWVSILMILWAVVGGQASSTAIFTDGCSNVDDDLQSTCVQFVATQSFSWLQFAVLLLWLAVVMVVAAMAHNRGHTRVWMYPFQDATILCRPSIPRDSYAEGKAAIPEHATPVSPARPASVQQNPIQGYDFEMYRPMTPRAPSLHRNVEANGGLQHHYPTQPPQYTAFPPTTSQSQQRLSMLSQA